VEVRSRKQSPRATLPAGTLGAQGASVVRKLSDESLLAGLGSGDPDAAVDFVRRFQRRVFGLTFAILRDRAAAEEAAQESFLRAWRHASAYDPRRGTVAAWLLTIARNVSINMLPRAGSTRSTQSSSSPWRPGDHTRTGPRRRW
jgi:DNA-directed RNA polymerase specialized sigma24 family protein